MPKFKHASIRSITLGEVEYTGDEAEGGHVFDIPEEHVATLVDFGFVGVADESQAAQEQPAAKPKKK